jgi:Protein of unknown function (DUF4231)
MPEMQEPVAATDPTLARLEDQITWYDNKSRAAQRVFKRAKLVEILAAAMIPFLAAVSFPYDKLVTAGLGIVITILEGVLHLNQYQQIWSSYRSTCEALKHEKFTYLASAGPYRGTPNPLVTLAERIESLVSQEHAQWSSMQQQSWKATNAAAS